MENGKWKRVGFSGKKKMASLIDPLFNPQSIKPQAENSLFGILFNLKYIFNKLRHSFSQTRCICTVDLSVYSSGKFVLNKSRGSNNRQNLLSSTV